MEEMWMLIESLMPSDVEIDINNDEATFSSEDNSVKVIYIDEGVYQINGQTLHFEDDNFEIVNTILVPYILQELDGHRRM